MSSAEYVTSVMKNVLSNKKIVKMLMFALQKKFGRGYMIKIKSVYRFKSNKHTHMFLFVAQAFWVFIVRICFFLCTIWVYLKSLNGNPACDC